MPCSVGPLHSHNKYTVTAEKEGYIMTETKQGNFKAFKLGEIIVKVSKAECYSVHFEKKKTKKSCKHILRDGFVMQSV